MSRHPHPIDRAHPSPSGLTLTETRDLIDAVHSPVALLDGEGCILSVNGAWEALGTGGEADLGCSERGANYRVVCEKAARRANVDADLFARGLAAVLSGEQPAFEMDSACPVGNELHVIRARVTRLADVRGPYFLVRREDVSAEGPQAAA